MSTETIDTATQPAPAPAWKRGLEQATAATWKAIGVPTQAVPFCVVQKDYEGRGEYAGDVCYQLLEPLLQIAAAYDVPVSESTAGGGGTTYSAVVPVDGINVTIWTTNPADAPTAVEG
ncbi:hypothetical protein ACWGIT_19125 [Streptomyces cyaneofuscatus]